MNGDKAVTATFTEIPPVTYTLTVDTVGNGHVDQNATSPVIAGRHVELTAVPDSGWEFAGWSVDLTGSENPKSITMDGDKAVTATFTEIEYSLTVTPSGGGSVTLNDTGPYHLGDVVELTAAPDSGWSFSEWGGAVSGSANPISVTMDGDKAVTATFTEIEYTLTVNVAGSGSVSRNNAGPYHYGDVVQLTASPGTGYSFTGWSGGLSGSSNPATITMNGDKAVTATFTYTSGIQVTVNGAIGQNKLSLGTNMDFSQWNLWLTSSAKQQLTSDINIRLIRIFDFRSSSPLLRPCTNWNSVTHTGTFNWANVDNLVNKIFAVGAEPLIVLGWARVPMTSYIPSGMAINPSTNLPDPDDYAAYCRAWVAHFQSTGKPVRYYEVTNEPWFYFGWNNQPQLDNFMALFVASSTAMRDQNPSVRVSFDGTNRKPILDYILSNNIELGFVSFHKYDEGSLDEYSDAEVLNRAETFQVKSSSSYYGIAESKQRYYNKYGVNIPAIMSEYNYNSYSSTGTDPEIQKMVGAVWTALTLRTSILEGLDYSVAYDFSSSKSYEQTKGTGGFGFGMINSDDNNPWYTYYVQQFIGQNLQLGDDLRDSTSSSSDIRTLAWMNSGTLNILIINKVDQPRTVVLSGISGQLYLSKIDQMISYLTPSIQTATINGSDPINLNGYAVLHIKVIP
jgi:uncharacterized repeat protein (TIGR02543 family)